MLTSRRLGNGYSIHTVSALLLQLVQTSAHDVRVQLQRLASEREQSFVLNHQPDSQEEQPPGPTERDYQELQLYTTGLEPTTKAARTMITFLTKRSDEGLQHHCSAQARTADLEKGRLPSHQTTQNTGSFWTISSLTCWLSYTGQNGLPRVWFSI